MSSSPPPEVVTFRDVSPEDDPTPEDLPDSGGARTPDVLAEAAQPRNGLRDRLVRAREGVRPWSAWTLRAKLVASMLALFTVLSLATAAFTVIALDRQLNGQVDDQLRSSMSQMLTRRTGPNGFEDRDGGPRGPGDAGLMAYFPSPATTDVPGAIGTASRPGQAPALLTTSELDALNAAGIGSQPTTANVGDLGPYRLVSSASALQNTATGAITRGTLVIGLPIAQQQRTVQRMAGFAIATVAAGIILVFVIGSWIVRRNLEPLQRVADTATRVSRMPLASGKVALADRVDPADTDTRTEVGQVGAALNEMLDHVDEALNSRHRSEQRVRQFVADASHELRTPLASIKGYAELSRRETEEVPTSVTHAMGRIESEANRMSSLVEDLLLLARLDAGRPLEQKPVDLSMIVINAVSDAHAASPDHVWDLDLPPEPIEVTGDTARLHQVAANLLANARTHTPSGTRVTTSIRKDAGWVRLTVHDNGPGVPESLQPNVFERFARGDDARNRAGGSTGLGLSIVAAVAKALGGRVELQSRPGDTTFTVLLPATAPVAAEAEAASVSVSPA